MSYHHNRGTLFVDLCKLFHNLVRVSTIKCACGLICKEELGLVDETPADARSLELAAGHFVDVVVSCFDYSQLAHEVFAVPGNFLSRSLELLALKSGKQDVVEDSEILHHVHLLEDESHLIEPYIGKFVLLHFRDVLPVEKDCSARRLVHSGNAVEQCRFA